MDKTAIIFNLDNTVDLFVKVLKKIASKRHYVETGEVNIQEFKDGETCVNFETSVRGKRVFILCSPNSSLKIIQLNLAIDAAKRASASEIIPILPYFPYSRQDKRDQYRGPIGAKVMAEMLENRGATSVIVLDLHANQEEGFFNIPVIHLKSKYLFYKYVTKIGDSQMVLCSPDAGGVKRVKKMKDLILKKHSGVHIPYVMIDKTRTEANKVDEMIVVGDVDGKHVLIIDDMCDTGNTLIKAVNTLMEHGANKVSVMVTHPVLSGDAIDIIDNSKIHEFICSDSLQIYGIIPDKFTVISIDGELANTIISINTGISVLGGN